MFIPFMIYKKVFITGGNGFIGANLIIALINQEYDVSALIHKGSTHPFLKQIPFKIIEGDLFDYKKINKIIKECDAVIHCAARVSFNEKEKREIYHTNVEGSNIIFRLVLKHKKKVVFISTASSIGRPTKKPILLKETEPFVFEDISSYSHSKYLAEQNLLRFVKKGLKGIIVNLSTVYGAGDLHGTGPSLYALIKKYPIFFAPPGGCSVIAVEDVCSGIIAALEKGRIGERYILTNENITYKKLFEIMLKVIKKKNIYCISLPTFIASFGLYMLKNLPISSKIITPSVFSNLFRYRYLSNEKAKKELGWKPLISVEEAIIQGYIFYQSQCEKYGR